MQHSHDDNQINVVSKVRHSPRKVLRPGTYMAQSHGVGYFGHTTSSESSIFEILPPGKKCPTDHHHEHHEATIEQRQENEKDNDMTATTAMRSTTPERISNLRWNQREQREEDGEKSNAGIISNMV